MATTNGVRKPYASPQDFRTKVFKDVTLPGGLLVKIRSVQAYDLISKWDLPMPTTPEGEETPERAPETEETRQDTIDRGIAWRDGAILHGCVIPPFVPRGQGTEDALGLDELGNDDYEALSQAILRHSGLAPEVAETVEAFRQDAERPDRGADGGEIPRPAASGLAGDASGVLPERPPGEPGHDAGGTYAVSPTAPAPAEHSESVGAI